MKKLILLTISLIAITSCSNNNEWNLVWQDEFKSNEIDTTYWTKITRGGADWNRHMSSYDSLYEITDGKMILHGINNHTQKGDTAKFLTGGVFTKGKQLFHNGRVEVMAKVSSAQGFWPAIWLLPQDVKWPYGGEIDLMEHLNHDSVVYQTIHTQYTLKHGIKDNPRSGAVPAYKHNDWNLFALEMYQDSLVFFVNDTKSYTYPRIKTDLEEQFPFADQPFYLLIDAQLGGGWVGKVDPEQLPAKMEIDYVRFYQKEK